MSIIALGLSGELKADGIAANTLWPRTTIATAAVRNLLGGDALIRRSRTPEIMGDAAHLILTQDAKTFTARFCIDDTLLFQHGVTDFEKYRVDKTQELAPDFFVPDNIPPPPGVTLGARMR
jgi:citronellol/citronellal dehydrogenase